jgi:hypothetical protein
MADSQRPSCLDSTKHWPWRNQFNFLRLIKERRGNKSDLTIMQPFPSFIFINVLKYFFLMKKLQLYLKNIIVYFQIKLMTFLVNNYIRN